MPRSKKTNINVFLVSEGYYCSFTWLPKDIKEGTFDYTDAHKLTTKYYKDRITAIGVAKKLATQLGIEVSKIGRTEINE